MKTIAASEFKATCLDLFDQVASGELDRVVVTKRGRVVGMLVPPEPDAAPDDVFGCMRGTVTISPGVKLSEPVSNPFEAEGAGP